jgi:hypothetical protein
MDPLICILCNRIIPTAEDYFATPKGPVCTQCRSPHLRCRFNPWRRRPPEPECSDAEGAVPHRSRSDEREV